MRRAELGVERPHPAVPHGANTTAGATAGPRTTVFASPLASRLMHGSADAAGHPGSPGPNPCADAREGLGRGLTRDYSLALEVIRRWMDCPRRPSPSQSGIPVRHVRDPVPDDAERRGEPDRSDHPLLVD